MSVNMRRLKIACASALIASTALGMFAGFTLGRVTSTQKLIIEYKNIAEPEKTEPKKTKESETEFVKLSAEPTAEQKETINLGEFEVTAYCPCEKCSEGWGIRTSTGALAEQGRTIAVDPVIIPYGTEVIIGGHTYIAEDCGGLIKGKKIDIFLDNHEDTVKFGKQKMNVEIIR